MSSRTPSSSSRTSGNRRVHSRYVASSSSQGSKPQKPSLARPDRRNRNRVIYQNPRKRYDRVQTSIREAFPGLPESASVIDVQGPLAKIHVAYTDASTDAHRWRGAIIDWRTNRVIKEGNTTGSIKVPEGTLLSELPEAQPKGNGPFYFAPVFDGAVVSVFKYEGMVYFSTGRSLGIESSGHLGAINIPEVLKSNLPAGLMESMFPEEITTNIYYYDFILLDRATLDVTRTNITSDTAVIFLERGRLLNTSGSVRAVTIDEGKTLDEATPYPTEGGFYKSSSRIPMGIAQRYLDGELSGAELASTGEAVLAVERDATTDRIISMTRIESSAYTARHNIRGNVQNLVVRLTQLIGDYVLEDDRLVPLKSGDPIIILPSDSTSMLDSLYEILLASLPTQREDELEIAMSKIRSLIDRLSHFFRIPYNPKHPAAVYWNRAQDLRTNAQRENLVLRMDSETLYATLNWYRLLE